MTTPVNRGPGMTVNTVALLAVVALIIAIVALVLQLTTG